MSQIDVYFHDVGQGQSSTITNAKDAIVLDCGYGAAKHVGETLNSRSLLLVLVTHLDMDHCGDLMKIVRNHDPAMVRLNLDTAWKADHESPKLLSLIRGLRDRTWAQSEDFWQPASVFVSASTPTIHGVQWEILAPNQADLAFAHSVSDRNAASVILRVTVGDRSILYTGDTNDKVLNRVISDGKVVKADVLVVPHHGGNWSSSPPVMTSEALYEAVQPSIAVFSVGSRNSYLHPSAESLEVARLRAQVRVMCTEVTERCHQGVSKDHPGLPCAGPIRLKFDGLGAMEVTPAIQAHLQRIHDWTSPKCMLGPGR